MSTIKISNLTPLTDLVTGNIIVPLVSNVGGTLTTVRGNVDQLGDYLLADLESNVAALQSNATVQQTAIYLSNVTLKSYVDGQIASANAGVTAANVGMKGYVDYWVAAIEGGEYSNVNVAAYLNTAGYNLYSNVNVVAYLSSINNATQSDVTAANVGLKGYVDQANTIQSAQITAANVGMKGYVDAQTYSNVNVSSFLPGFTSGNIGPIGLTANLTSIFTAVAVGFPSPLTFSNVVISGTNDANGYVQLNIQNTNTFGNLVSADFIATAPNGTDTTNYIDLGINGNNFSSGSWTVSGPNDGYVYVNGGNLTVGTDSAGKTVAVHVGGVLAENIVTTFTETEVNVAANLVISNTHVPTLANSTGTTGTIVWDSNYIYICVGTDTWKRANISTW